MFLTFDISQNEFLTQNLVLSSIWKMLFVFLLLVNLKNLPFVWHVSSPVIILFSHSLTCSDPPPQCVQIRIAFSAIQQSNTRATIPTNDHLVL